MKKTSILIVIVLMINILQAQVSEGGMPYAYSNNSMLNNLEQVVLPNINLQQLQYEDQIFDQQKDIPWRFGVNFTTNYTLNNSGTWKELANGDRVWLLKLKATNAQTFNFLYENFYLAKDVKLFMFNDDFSSVLGAFTNKNNRSTNMLPTDFVNGETVYIELYEPKEVKGKSHFSITRVTHGYRTYKTYLKGIGDSGSCNNNVICSVGDNWRDQIKAVGLLLQNGNSFCSGTMINNTCNDLKPYFLTANHCTDANQANSYVVKFNFESTTCTGNTGPYSNQSVAVLTERASNPQSDFALLELTQIPPPEYDVFYVGWDRTGNIPSSQVGIHHPSGDVKKISFDNQSASQALYPWNNSTLCWHISDWEDGTTEGGSSGSSLFNQNGLLIGQLYGGSANCGNNVDDYYGRFDVSWNQGTNSTNELQSWLDDCNTNATTITGISSAVAQFTNDVQLTFANRPTNQKCGTTFNQRFRVRNNGSNQITSVTFNYGIENNLNTYTWTGTLDFNDSEFIDLEDLYLCNDSYNYILEMTSSNLATDENMSNNEDSIFFEVTNGSLLEVNVKTNYQGNETSFKIFKKDGSILYSETNFTDNAMNSFSYCLPIDSYRFEIYDSGNNGLTPTFFNVDAGYYELKLNGNVLINNDAFASSEVTVVVSEGNGLKADFINANGVYTVSDFYSTSIGTINNYNWYSEFSTPQSTTNSHFETTFNALGNYDITLTIKNDEACDIVTKQININTFTAIEYLENNIDLELFPNPTKDILNLKSQNNFAFTIYNLLGEIVYSSKNNFATNYQINVKEFSKGMYNVIAKNKEGKRSVIKFIVK